MVLIQGHFTFSTSLNGKWHMRHWKTTYSQSRWLIKEPNSQSPKNLTYLHRKGVPLQVIRGCSNQPYLSFATRTIFGIGFGGMDVLRWGHRILWICCMYAHLRLSCALISQILHAGLLTSEGVCPNSTNFDVVLS